MATATTPQAASAAAPTAMGYSQAMNGLDAILIASPPPSGIVVLKAAQLTRIQVRAGEHYKLRQLGPDGVLQTPDNLIAVRHGDDLHVRYGDGSVAHLEQFFAVCTDASVCSVNLASDDPAGVTVGASDLQHGHVGDDGLMVYAHGEYDAMMAMAQSQPSLESAFRALDDRAVITYPGEHSVVGFLALAALGAAAIADASHTSGSTTGNPASPDSSAQAALNAISAAAQNNTASATVTSAAVYAAAGATGVDATNLSAINSALNSLPIDGARADTTPEVQAIVDAYKAILASADGIGGNTTTPLTGAQYSAIGVTGVTGTAAAGTILALLNNTVDAIPRAGVDTVAEVQTLADAAAHVLASAGGTPAQSDAVTLLDLSALGITGVTTANLLAVQTAIHATVPDSAIDTRSELQAVVDTAIAGIGTALGIISAAAEANSATLSSPSLTVYAQASVSGVTDANLPSVSSALNSLTVNGVAADTTPEVQAIVDSYSAILASADGVAGNTSPALTGTQYATIGVTGVSGTAAPGNALFMLNSTVDILAPSAVDTVPELQQLADAANHVLAAAGGTLAQAGAVTLTDLTSLGIYGVTAGNLAAVQTAIQATAPDYAIDTRAELQAIVNGVTNAGPSQVTLASALVGVSNLEVTSNLVLSASQTVSVGAGFIHITDLGGAGYQGDTSNNTQNIDVGTAVQNGWLSITGSGANTKIVINPQWDLDLASNYRLSMDDGAFVDSQGAPIAVAAMSFSTITPGTHTTGSAASEAVAAQTMVDATGGLAAGKSWLDIQGIGNNTGPVTQLGTLAGGAYALVMKNYATARGGDAALGGNGSDGIITHDSNVGVTNFGNNDMVYFDSQVNNSAIQFFDARYTGMTDGATVGGLAGQNTLVLGLIAAPAQQGSTAMLLLGLEGNTAGTIYPAITSLPDGTIGWANVWHAASAPVVMG